MMDVLFNQDYVTEVHEKNLVWEGYDKGKTEGKAEGINECIQMLRASGASEELIEKSLKLLGKE